MYDIMQNTTSSNKKRYFMLLLPDVTTGKLTTIRILILF